MPSKNKTNLEKKSSAQKEKPQVSIDETKELKDKIVKLEEVVLEQNNKILRVLAESENIRKRSAQDLEKANKYAVSKLAGELVLVVENFFLAVDNMPKEEIEQSDKLKNFATGVVMTQKELVKILEQNSIKRIHPVGEKFDHNLHEAISSVTPEGDDQESGAIKRVIQAGYTIGDRLIRPALVEVYQ